jgi:hypothetical protein
MLILDQSLSEETSNMNHCRTEVGRVQDEYSKVA